ncbi:MAG: hypothetical protein MOGMAGMI_00866 [Candidatus Omnitrophica bacterium]|nr:hypothetical protein [Candidatus Omnitrophota bacterium]
MIREILQDLAALKSGRKELREFAWTMAIASGLLAAWLAWRHPSPAVIVLVALGIVLVSCGTLRPELLAPVRRVWMGLAFVLGFFMSRMILAVCYYLVITPIGLITRATGKDFLSRKMDPQTSTYWTQRQNAEDAKARLERQF